MSEEPEKKYVITDAVKLMCLYGLDQINSMLFNEELGTEYPDQIADMLRALPESCHETEATSLRSQLRESTEHMEQMLKDSDCCGDPWAECPMQDAHKDHDMAGIIKRNNVLLPHQP